MPSPSQTKSPATAAGTSHPPEQQPLSTLRLPAPPPGPSQQPRQAITINPGLHYLEQEGMTITQGRIRMQGQSVPAFLFYPPDPAFNGGYPLALANANATSIDVNPYSLTNNPLGIPQQYGRSNVAIQLVTHNSQNGLVDHVVVVMDQWARQVVAILSCADNGTVQQPPVRIYPPPQ